MHAPQLVSLNMICKSLSKEKKKPAPTFNLSGWSRKHALNRLGDSDVWQDWWIYRTVAVFPDLEEEFLPPTGTIDFPCEPLPRAKVLDFIQFSQLLLNIKSFSLPGF